MRLNKKGLHLYHKFWNFDSVSNCYSLLSTFKMFLVESPNDQVETLLKTKILTSLPAGKLHMHRNVKGRCSVNQNGAIYRGTSRNKSIMML